MKVFSVLATVLTAAAAISAAPTAQHEVRDVWSPKVLYPHAGTVWYSGQRHNVTWDLSSQPVNITNNPAFILLKTENFVTPVVLGYNFLLTDGRVEITVPDVISRPDYSVVLVGTGDNWGDQFRINGPIADL
ncbi:hypothetical protein BDY19DRAFT_1059093 [Irpex rosettiformis]|uniref:Uncharacterized protein n=1 Tax=Irpex rosettiformis TaxID=378272 RepID=A0ACB8TW82_9APHY|nr:hypothetical protein BDY19DRAFT_1059093 [Irpex rosettiformis]